ncbi:MAG: hypothetical protein ACTHLL_02515 [Candidatus Nitrosocosmicus sp.]
MLYNSKMVTGSPIKDDHIDSESDNKNNRSSNIKYSEPKSSAFNGKVMVGIGGIMAVAAIITIAMGFLSQSPQIHLSLRSIIPSYLSSSLISPTTKTESVTAQQSTSLPPSASDTSANHYSKRIVLIQQDFGWNGTYGGPPILLNKGDVVQLLVINRGHMAHNFGIALLPQQVLKQISNQNNIPLDKRIGQIPYDTMAAMPCPGCQSEFEKGHIKLFIEPGTQQVSSFVADKPGHYNYFCMVRGHLWLGMIGDLIVRESTGSTTIKSDTNNI